MDFIIIYELILSFKHFPLPSTEKGVLFNEKSNKESTTTKLKSKGNEMRLGKCKRLIYIIFRIMRNFFYMNIELFFVRNIAELRNH